MNKNTRPNLSTLIFLQFFQKPKNIFNYKRKEILRGPQIQNS